MNPFAVYAAAGIAIASAAAGWRVRDWQCDAAVAKALEKADKQRAELQKRADFASASYEALRSSIQEGNYVRQQTVREIYRKIEVPSECAAPDSAVGLLQGSINNANANATGKLGGSVSGDQASP